jgi:hypothetical protein
MLLKNKDLNIILDSFLRVIPHHRQDWGRIPALAIVLTSEGKLAQFSGQANRVNTSAAEAVHYLERGVYTLVREGRCRAIGIPFDMTASGEAEAPARHAFILLEHQDGSAYRIQVPYSDDGSIRMPLDDLVAVLTEPRFFLRMRFP